MALESVRGYLQLASGLSEMTRTKAVEVANDLMSLPGLAGPAAMAGQVSQLADELVAAALANRANLVSLIRGEVESAIGRSGYVSVAELDKARGMVARLGAELDEIRDHVFGSSAAEVAVDTGIPLSATGTSVPRRARATARPGSRPGTSAASPTARNEGSMATKATAAPAKKAAAKKSAAKSGTAKKASAATKTTAKKTSAAKSGTAKKTSAAKSGTAKKTSAAKSGTAKKSSPAAKKSATKTATTTTRAAKKS